MIRSNIFWTTRRCLNSVQELVRIFKFYLVGGLNTIVSLSLYSVLVLFSVSFQIALLVATMFSIFFNYVTYRKFVFAEADTPKRLGFLLIYALVYVINVTLIDVVVGVGVSEIPAGIAVSLATSLAMFVLLKFHVFAVSRK